MKQSLTILFLFSLLFPLLSHASETPESEPPAYNSIVTRAERNQFLGEVEGEPSSASRDFPEFNNPKWCAADSSCCPIPNPKGKKCWTQFYPYSMHKAIDWWYKPQAMVATNCVTASTYPEYSSCHKINKHIPFCCSFVLCSPGYQAAAAAIWALNIGLRSTCCAAESLYSVPSFYVNSYRGSLELLEEHRANPTFERG